MVTALVSLLSSMLALLYPMSPARADADPTPTVRVVVTTRLGFAPFGDSGQSSLEAERYAFVSRQPNLGTFTVEIDGTSKVFYFGEDKIQKGGDIGIFGMWNAKLPAEESVMTAYLDDVKNTTNGKPDPASNDFNSAPSGCRLPAAPLGFPAASPPLVRNSR